MDLERCFEASVPPPAAFLKWLVSNPSKLRWKGKALDDGSATSAKRRALSGETGPAAQQQAMQEALGALETFGAAGSGRKWWAFEGFTSVDCLLESDNAVLLIEGKRNDVVSEATDWYAGRNQVIRNLEVAEIRAAGRPFGVLVISESGEDPISPATFTTGLPHLPEGERTRLREHYLGCVSWHAVCRAVGIEYERLPSTVVEALAG